MKNILASAWAKAAAFALLITSLIGLAPSLVPSADAATAPSCYNLTAPLFFYQDSHYSQTVAWTTFYKSWDGLATTMALVSKYKASVPALQSFLEREGFAIAASEKAVPTIGPSTASAITAFQEKYASEILTPQGLTHGTGYVDSYTVKALNQRYGCVNGAIITLVEPNAKTVRARGETMLIRWTAARIPNTTTLNIQYTKADGTGATRIASSTIGNGAGSYTWTVPSDLASGTYKVLLSLEGAASSDVSAAAFEIRDTSLQVTYPVGGESVSVGQKVALGWKTSASIPATTLMTVNLIANRSGTVSTSTIVSGIRNSGSYAWTVPDVFTGAPSGDAATYSIQVVAGSVSSISNTFSIVPSNVVKEVNYTTPSCPYVFSTNLSMGSASSRDIIALQNMLKGLGHFVGNSNGVFGATTKTALMSFQTASGLTADGSFGPVTRQKANSVCNSTTSVMPVITIGNLAQSIARNGVMNVTWVPNSAIPAKATVSIMLVGNGQADVKLNKANVLAASGISQVTIPAGTIPGTYSIRLVPAGVTLDSTSAVQAGGIVVTAQSGSISPTLGASEAYKSDSLAVSWTGSNVQPASLVTVILIPTASTQVITSATAAYRANGLNLPIPSAIADGKYKVQVSTTVDGQTVTGTSQEFSVKTKVITTPHMVLTGPADGTVLVRGATSTVTWTASNVPAGYRQTVVLADASGRNLEALCSSVEISLLSCPVTVPAGRVPGSYRIKLVPNGVNLDSTSVVEKSYTIAYQSGSISASLSTTTPARNSSVSVSWTGSSSISPDANVTVAVTSASGAAVAGMARRTVPFNTGNISYAVPAGIADGTYTITVSTVVDTKPVSSSATFTVTSPAPTVSVAMSLNSLPVFSSEGILVSRGKTTANMIGKIPLVVSVSGAPMSQLSASDFAVSVMSASGSVIPVSAVTLVNSPAGAIAAGKSVASTLTVTVKPSDLPSTDIYYVAVRSVSPTQKGIRSTVSLDSSALRTNTFNFVK